MKQQTTKIQEGAGILKSTIPKTICDILEIEKGDKIQWTTDGKQATITKIQTIPTITQPDNNGICYQAYTKQTGTHTIAIDKKLFRNKYLTRRLNKKYGINIVLDPIPNDMIRYDIYNPEGIDVQYISWFDYDMTRSNEDMIQELQKYRKQYL